jgi:hypothetical protein
MGDPVVTSVRPVFKLRKGKATELAADKYLYAINLNAMTTMVKGGDLLTDRSPRPSIDLNR